MQMSNETYQKEVNQEIENILDYWLNNTIDDEFGGFYGQINENDEVVPNTEKGSVLNARILWTFSAAYHHNPRPAYLSTATRAYEYLRNYFSDKTFSGVYWSVDFKGNPLNTRKQIYGQAFVIYGLTEYYKVTQQQEVLDWAIDLFNIIETNSFDKIYGGYLEALAQNWQPIEDLKLSQKDANEKKSMNTHLHILEAYANLLKVWNNNLLKNKLKALIEIFIQYIVDTKTGHQYLFHDDDWTVKSHIISYGHDIETSWLLYEATEVLGDENLLNEVHKISLKITDAVGKGLHGDGGLAYESEEEHHDTNKHWWVQAEAMVGYLNAFQLSKNPKYLQQSIKSWEFIKAYLITPSGEWYWGVTGEQNKPMPHQDKVGFWKCPYHNVRACLEVYDRLEKISN